MAFVVDVVVVVVVEVVVDVVDVTVVVVGGGAAVVDLVVSADVVVTSPMSANAFITFGRVSKNYGSDFYVFSFIFLILLSFFNNSSIFF